MRTSLALLFIFGMTYFVCSSSGVIKEISHNMSELNSLKNDNTRLHIENKKLLVQINQYKYELKNIEAKNSFLKLKIEKFSNGSRSRSIASIPSKLNMNTDDDLVQYDIYKWSAEKLLAIASKELFFKNYKKAAQFYSTLITKYPNHKEINDKVYFEAGIAAYETGLYYSWAINHFNSIVNEYPKSDYRRGAKLWRALASLNTGDSKQFMRTVDEFRVKYRNTEEWRILSAYYENIAYKFKK